MTKALNLKEGDTVEAMVGIEGYSMIFGTR